MKRVAVEDTIAGIEKRTDKQSDPQTGVAFNEVLFYIELTLTVAYASGKIIY